MISFEARERLRLAAALVAGVIPFVPLGGESLYDRVGRYTIDTIGGATTGYVLTFLICWIVCLLPLLVLDFLGFAWQRRKEGADDA